MIKKKEKDILAANIGIPRMLPSIWSSAKFIAYFITEKREEWGKTSVVNSPFKSFLSTSTLFFCLFFHNLKVPINLANILTHDSPRNWIWCAETVPCTRYNFSCQQRKSTNYSTSIFLNQYFHYLCPTPGEGLPAGEGGAYPVLLKILRSCHGSTTPPLLVQLVEFIEFQGRSSEKAKQENRVKPEPVVR